jgi:hypothetical protein
MARWTIGEQTIVMQEGDQAGVRMVFANNPANSAEARLRIEMPGNGGAFELIFATGGPLISQRWRDNSLPPYSQDEDHFNLDQEEAAINERLNPASGEEKRKAALKAQAEAELEQIQERRRLADAAKASNERSQEFVVTSSASAFTGGGVARPNEALPSDINPPAGVQAPSPVTPDRLAQTQTSPGEPVALQPMALASQSATSGVETRSVVGTTGNAPTEAAVTGQTGGDAPSPQAVDTHSDLPGTGPGTHSVGDQGLHPAAEATAAGQAATPATDAGTDHSNDQDRGSVNTRGALPTGDMATDAGNDASDAGGSKKGKKASS